MYQPIYLNVSSKIVFVTNQLYIRRYATFMKNCMLFKYSWYCTERQTYCYNWKFPLTLIIAFNLFYSYSTSLLLPFNQTCTSFLYIFCSLIKNLKINIYFFLSFQIQVFLVDLRDIMHELKRSDTVMSSGYVPSSS